MLSYPEGVTEELFLAAVDNAVRLLAPNFTFGYYDVDDIRQEATLFAIEALPRYDTSRPLDNFLYVHIRNRLTNLKRNEYRRTDSPCALCHRPEGNRSRHPSGEFCARYLGWKKRNDAKANLSRPLDLDHIADEHESGTRAESEVEGDAQTRELLGLIDENLPVEMRATYLQMRAGKSVPKARRTAVERVIRQILGEDDAGG